jgi:hypothetical protein
MAGDELVVFLGAGVQSPMIAVLFLRSIGTMTGESAAQKI